jgi:hypothetical protein
MNVASALRECPPAGWGSTRQSINEIKEFDIPFERLLKRFLKRHPEIVWRVPYNNFADTLWAPTQFAKRQAELMKTKSLSEDEAYQEVVKEGGGGGDWNGVWETLEHDRVKSVLKKETQYVHDENQRKKNGVSLLKAYNEAQHADVKYGIAKTIWGAQLGGKHASRRAEKLLESRTASASKQEFLNDILDLGVLFKVRAIAEKRAEQARREQAANKSSASATVPTPESDATAPKSE